MDLPSLTPLVLLVDDQEWTSRSIESILRPKGHVVLKAYTGRQALDLVQKVSPDAMIVDFHLPDLDDLDSEWFETLEVPGPKIFFCCAVFNILEKKPGHIDNAVRIWNPFSRMFAGK